MVNQDLTTVNGRWPQFAAEARIEPGEMRQADVDVAQAFADVATFAILKHPPPSTL